MVISSDEYVQRLNWRYATKKFDSLKKISPNDWFVLEESLRLSPSSFGLQPWKFIVITNDEMKQKLKPISWNQTQIADCSHLVVLTTLRHINEDYIDRFVESMAQTRSTSVDTIKGYRDMMVKSLLSRSQEELQQWAQKQVYIAMGNVMTTAALLKIDSCPLEGIEQKKYDEALHLESTPYQTNAAVALGYRHHEDKYQFAKKVRFSTEEVFTFIP
jgi:nitroreductase